MTTIDVLEERIKAIEKIIRLNKKTSEDALILARETMETRLEGMNEFRNQLNEQTKTFIGRSEFDTKHAVSEEKIHKLENRMALVELAKAEIQGRVMSLGVIGAIMIIVLEFIMHYVVNIHGK